MFNELDVEEKIRRVRLLANEGRETAERAEQRLQNRVVRLFRGVEPHTHRMVNFISNGGLVTLEVDAHLEGSSVTGIISVFYDGGQIFNGRTRMVSHEVGARTGVRHSVRVEVGATSEVKIAVTGNGVRVV